MKYGSFRFLDVRKYNVFVCLIMDILSFQFLFRKYHLSEIVVRKDEIIVPKYYENKKYSYLFCYEKIENIRNHLCTNIFNIRDSQK